MYDKKVLAESNAIIARYVGLQPTELTDAWDTTGCDLNIPLTTPYIVGLHFHESWDWLIPVIGKLYKEYTNESNLQYIKDKLLTLDINATYRAVVLALSLNELKQE